MDLQDKNPPYNLYRLNIIYLPLIGSKFNWNVKVQICILVIFQDLDLDGSNLFHNMGRFHLIQLMDYLSSYGNCFLYLEQDAWTNIFHLVIFNSNHVIKRIYTWAFYLQPSHAKSHNLHQFFYSFLSSRTYRLFIFLGYCPSNE